LPLDISAGADVFIDANILHYAVVPIPPYTAKVLPFIDRLRRSEFIAYLNFQAISDAHHKTMASLATSQYQLTRSSIVGWLKSHPQAIKSLTGLAQAATMLSSLPLNLLPTDQDLLTEAAIIAQTHGLLTNDAIIVALMQRHGLTHLATNDDDFDRVPGITVWKPRP
jgi:predicted nucleic acid-binding protein